jgi:hypothetical protein
MCIGLDRSLEANMPLSVVNFWKVGEVEARRGNHIPNDMHFDSMVYGYLVRTDWA